MWVCVCICVCVYMSVSVCVCAEMHLDAESLYVEMVHVAVVALRQVVCVSGSVCKRVRVRVCGDDQRW